MDVFVIKCLNCSEELEETYKFCSRGGVAVDKEEVLIRYYFQRGFPYSVILLFLKKYHALEMSLRTFHNRLREYGLPSLQSMASARTSSFLNVHFAHQDRCISRGSCKTKIRETFEESFFPIFGAKLLQKAISHNLSVFYSVRLLHNDASTKIVHNSRDLGKDDTIDGKKL